MEIPIKVTPTSMITLEIKQMSSVIRILRDWNPCTLPGGMEEGVTKMECGMVPPHMSKRRASVRLTIPLVDIHPKDVKAKT